MSKDPGRQLIAFIDDVVAVTLIAIWFWAVVAFLWP